MRVSILSAVKNEELYINEMIESVRRQSFEDWELILVSDGSEDSTVARIRDAAARDTRVRYVGDGSRIGKVAAFNAAFEASVGDIVLLIGGDDTLPLGSLAPRVETLREAHAEGREAVAFFKIRTMSLDRRQDGLLLPRGTAASHSGGTITMTRSLAEKIFPVDDSLVSEDLWLSRAAEGVADEVIESGLMVLNYRIHPGNSNPRNKPFRDMDRAMTDRHRAWSALLDSPRFKLRPEVRLDVRRNAELEDLRIARRRFALLMYDAPLAERAAYLSMSSPALFWVRRRFFKQLSGRRGR